MMVLSAVLGTGSILLFAAMGNVGIVTLPWDEPIILLWDAALSLAFFLQHSGMVRKNFRARLEGMLPDHYQGAFYSIASGIFLTFVALFWQRTETHLYVLKGVLLWISLACMLFALAMMVWSVLALRGFDLLGLVPIRTHLRGKISLSTPFTVRGPYRYVRHPIYSAIILLFWVAPDMTTDRLLFNLLWTGWIIVGTLLEERDLAGRFGEQYREYQRNVPMLVPWRRPLAGK
jgi:protein-S-isoprenylcysteine O-methyltransferase Ste14